MAPANPLAAEEPALNQGSDQGKCNHSYGCEAEPDNHLPSHLSKRLAPARVQLIKLISSSRFHEGAPVAPSRMIDRGNRLSNG